MAHSSTEFFDGLARRGHEESLETTSGTVRFELENGARKERWLLSIDHGDLAVSHRNTAADCTFRTSREVFDGIATGEVNAMAAVLRGAVTIDGNWDLLVLVQRLFPGPSARSADAAAVGAGASRA